jgi:starvation-inducible DNA-binding protein
MNLQEAKALRTEPLQTPTNLEAEGVSEIAGALNILLSDVFALYVKTKNFHRHVLGPHFRDYHLLLDEQGEQIFCHHGLDRRARAQDERVRKIGEHDLALNRSNRPPSAQRGQRPRVRDPSGYAAELRDDNKELAANMRETHRLCERHNEVATTSLLEVWIDEAERRIWFLFEVSRAAESA